MSNTNISDSDKRIDAFNSIWCKYAGQLESDGIVFTGFKCDFDRTTLELFPERGFVAQWLNRGKRLYVNIPGLECGSYNPEASFDIGTTRIYLSTDSEEIGNLILAGLEKLKELVAVQP